MLPRVVSLLPSATEIVCALGCREALVGISHECDFPPGVEDLPHCCGLKRPLGRSSVEIDRSVRALLETALSVYRVDVAQLKALQPDIVITQAQCEVCAVSEDELRAALADWTGRRPQVVSLSPLTLNDVWDDIRRVAVALGRAPEAGELVERLAAAISEIAGRARDLPRPRVALIDWVDPLIMGGEWMPELVSLAGGVPLLATAGAHARRIEWEALGTVDPEIILIAPCGLSMEESEWDLRALQGHSVFESLAAVRNGKVYVADGKHYFNRPGPRLVESLEITAEIVHPERFHFGHEGRAWRRFQR